MEWTIQIVTPDLPKAPQTPYTKSMINQEQMQSILAQYTKEYNAMMARSAAAKADVAAGTEILTPAPEAGTWGIWNISDRH